MATTKKKVKLTLPPTSIASTIDEQAMIEMINKGGSSVAKPEYGLNAEPEDKLKSFTFKIYESELAKIRQIQDRLPKRDRISIHDFVLAAVLDRINEQLDKQLK